ncbi:hypothetical protein CEP88_06240 [Roseobacter denitrificans]|uniref:hypothetical protein n=1 Tax=Roseobacter denitrificans TaxID=2434 RepID=UPI000325164F|nr:hypothetical protein [Roseobacter denitrificans]AVL52227.1 hypothetical protein CEP88_06240 [Roseobacter denitrificans]SFF95436.1 hypothetical protein SAMN05443635_104241 [Roseobacter denitrificans OCh 114]
MDADDFSFRRQGRSRAALLTVTGVWSVLILLSITVDAAPWLMLAVAAFTLPALWELYSNPASGLDFRPDRITWFTGRRQAAINWCEIDRFRLDTRLDFSVRATAVLTSGRKIRLPYECTPHHALLEAALNARGVRTERHHFSLIG